MKKQLFKSGIILLSILSISILSISLLTGCPPSKSSNNSNGNGNDSKPVPCRVNLYIENSASMYGYVDAGSKFADNLGNLLADLKLSGIVAADSNISCYYINSKAYRINKTHQNCLKDIKNDIKSKAYGDNKGTTHIDKLIENVLSNTDESSLSVLVSDMILSPGKNNDASQFMISTRNNIGSHFNGQTDRAAVLYHCSTPYKGLYYNHVDASKSINNTRPYYVLVIGKLSLIKKFLAKQNNSNKRFISNNSVRFFDYSLVSAFRINSVSSGKISSDKKSIQSAKLNNNKFQFTVAVDLSEILEDAEYIKNLNNWKVNTPKYTITNVKEQQGVGGTTHIVTVSTTDKSVNKQLLKLSLKRENMPQWVEKFSICAENAQNIFDSSYLDKTFGLKEIVDGIYDGYYYNKPSSYVELKIQIN